MGLISLRGAREAAAAASQSKVPGQGSGQDKGTGQEMKQMQKLLFNPPLDLCSGDLGPLIVREKQGKTDQG